MRRWALALWLLGGFASGAVAQMPPPPEPPENPITPQKAVLGKILFWEEQMSSDNSLSCGTCHQPRFGGSAAEFVRTPGFDEQFGTPDDVFSAPGVRDSGASNWYRDHPVWGFEPVVGGRAPQTNIVAQYNRESFWDGRASGEFRDPITDQVLIRDGGSLETQSMTPPVSRFEMAHRQRDWQEILDKLVDAVPLALATDLPPDVAAAIGNHPTYPDLFAFAFGGDRTLTAGKIGFALATYQRTLLPDQTPWDLDQLTQAQRRGRDIFRGRANCTRCHEAPLFMQDTFRNIGLRPSEEDLGRQRVTGDRDDRGRFKIPSLRNAGLRPRFMHNGEFSNLAQVIDYYNMGGRNNDNQDGRIDRLRLNQGEQRDLRDFVENGLTDPRVANETYPFDRPTLYSERATSNPDLYGEESPGTGGFVPQMLAVVPPNVGNVDFKCAVHGGLGGSTALFALSTASASEWINGIPVNILANDDTQFIPYKLRGEGAGRGHATYVKGLPDDPALAGLEFFAQWFVMDPQATGGFAGTKGARFEMF